MNISKKIVIVSQGGRSHDITAHSGLSHTAGGAAPADEFDLESLEISKAIHADSSVLEIAEIIAQVFEKNFDEAAPVNSFMQTAFNIKEELK